MASVPETTSREPIEHDVKCWPPYFDAVLSGEKPFEVRKADRDYRPGDTMRLREYLPERDFFTGRHVLRRIAFRLDGGAFGVEPGFVVLGIVPDADYGQAAIDAARRILTGLGETAEPSNEPPLDWRLDMVAREVERALVTAREKAIGKRS